MSVYFVALIDIDDRVAFQKYAEGVNQEHMNSLGGEVLVVTDEPDVRELEGSWDHGRMVIMRFPTEEALMEWYESDEYAGVRQIRWDTATSTVGVHPAFGLDLAMAQKERSRAAAE